MKKKSMLLSVLLVAVMLLAACGSKTPVLQGRYVASSKILETNYEFSKDGSVTVKLITGGYVAIEETGTYAINEEGTEITMDFPDDATADLGILSFSVPDLDGTFTFSEGEGYIKIGSMQYEKVEK